MQKTWKTSLQMAATVKKDPRMKTERKLSQIVIRNKDHIAPKTYRQLSQHYTKRPNIYDLPKDSKSILVFCSGQMLAAKALCAILRVTS